MANQIRRIKSEPVQRMLLTDTLPYEVPLYFSNISLYRHFTEDSAPQLIKALFDLQPNIETIPAVFLIKKRATQTRSLSILHPAAQLNLARFYRQYDQYISLICSRSPYSLRAPTRVASRFYDGRFVDQDDDPSTVEMTYGTMDVEKPTASSYFAYQKHNQIYKFFESREYRKFEQQYTHMLRLDISNCFQSIYTHSIAWAVRGKEFSKKNRKCDFFEDKFDEIMRHGNWGETNGISVGPETSRIFAEIILQAADLEIAKRLPNQITFRRYIDDYFVFGHDEKSLEVATIIIGNELQKFNLYLNESKKKIQARPLVTPLTIARAEANTCVKNFIAVVKDCLTVQANEAEKQGKARRVSKHSNKTWEAIRFVVANHTVNYQEISSPALSIIARQLHTINLRCSTGTAEEPRREAFLAAISATLHLAENLYLMDIRSATSNKMARIFLESKAIATKLNINIAVLEAQILDITRKSIFTAKLSGATLADVINTAIAADFLLTSPRRLSKVDIESLFSTSPASEGKICYLSTIGKLYFARDRSDLRHLRDNEISAIKLFIKRPNGFQLQSTNETLLLIDLMGCPYLPAEVRDDLYIFAAKSVLGSSPKQAEARSESNRIARNYGFTTWRGLASLRSLLAKRELRPAYD